MNIPTHFQRICKACSREFTGRSRSFYCSDECRPHRTCAWCKCAYVTHKSGGRKFCSRSCELTSRKTAYQEKMRAKEIPCPGCGKKFVSTPEHRTACSYRCAWDSRFPVGTIRPSGGGYVIIKVGRDYKSPNKIKTPSGIEKQWMLQHRYAMELHIGRFLEPQERVHHKNGKRDDNRIENLELWKIASEHITPAGVRSSDYHCPGCRCRDTEKSKNA